MIRKYPYFRISHLHMAIKSLLYHVQASQRLKPWFFIHLFICFCFSLLEENPTLQTALQIDPGMSWVRWPVQCLWPGDRDWDMRHLRDWKGKKLKPRGLAWHLARKGYQPSWWIANHEDLITQDGMLEKRLPKPVGLRLVLDKLPYHISSYYTLLTSVAALSCYLMGPQMISQHCPIHFPALITPCAAGAL